MQRLYEIENVAGANPDSALRLLSRVSVDSLSTPQDSNLYNLLMAETRVRSGCIPMESDTLRRVVRYYKDIPDDNERRLMIAEWNLAQSYIACDRYDLAIHPLLDAERLAISLDDQFRLGLIYRSLSETHSAVFNNVEGYNYDLLAVAAFEKAGNEEYANYERCNVAIGLNNLFRYKDALTLLQNVEHMARVMKDTVTILTAIEIQGVSNLGLKRWQKSVDCYKMLERVGHDFSDKKYRECLVYAYGKLGEVEKADSILSEQKLSGNEVRVSLHSYYASKLDYKTAYEQLKQQHWMQDSMFRLVSGQHISETVTRYHEAENDKEALRAENRQLFLLLVILAVVLAATMIVSLIVIRKRRVEKRMARLMREYNVLVDDFNSSKAMNDRQSEAWKLLLKKRFSTLNELFSEYYHTPEKKQLKYLAENIENRLKELRDNVELNTEFVNGVFADINAYKENLMEELRHSDHKMSQSDFFLLALICSGFSNQAIGFILNIEVSAVYSRKKRLKHKVANLQFERKTELLDLF